jgi:Flp pilus assembly protein TadB
MDIQSVSSGFTSATTGSTQAQALQQVEKREPTAQEKMEKKEEPRPVVNTDGQKTGTLINVTA